MSWILKMFQQTALTLMHVPIVIIYVKLIVTRLMIISAVG